MKRKVINAFPEIFSLLANSDYSRFVVASQPAVAARRTWGDVGTRLSSAVSKVGKDVQKVRANHP